MALSAAAGKITLGEMTLYVIAFRQGQQSFQSVLGALGSLYEHGLYMSNLFQFLAIPVVPRLEAAAIASSGGGIRFETWKFRRESRSRSSARTARGRRRSSSS
jgi:ATP-binding cassette subfamily B protein